MRRVLDCFFVAYSVFLSSFFLSMESGCTDIVRIIAFFTFPDAALDDALRSMVVNKVNDDHVASLLQHLSQLDTDGEDLMPIDQQRPRLARCAVDFGLTLYDPCCMHHCYIFRSCPQPTLFFPFN